MVCQGKHTMSKRDQTGEHNPSWAGGKITKICEHCGKEFKIHKSKEKYGSGSFCSSRCWYDSSTKPRMTAICQSCGEEFTLRQYDKDRGHGQYCSKSCLARENGKKLLGIPKSEEHKKNIGIGCEGEKSYRWNGGTKRQGGYIFNRIKKGKYMQEHRQVAERALGRKLRPGECVHHINGIQTDNRNCNLLICATGYHAWLHRKMGFLYQQEHFLGSGAGASV